MPLLIVAIALILVSVAIVSAYVGWLMTAKRRVISAAEFEDRVLVVVPVFDEASLIDRKLENLTQLEGAERIVLVDGGSTDGTLDRIRSLLATHPRIELLETQHRDKTAQLNHALRVHADAEWILVTDADALLGTDTLRRLKRVVAEDVGVVGASVRPAEAHALESLHWRVTDWLRDREWDRGSAGIVAAPCYLARREFLEEMPPDTLADDVHVACRAMAAGKRVAHADATVTELRSPRTLTALLRHKYRKADAYLREIVRFLPAVPRVPSPMRAIFLWRAVLLTIVPLVAVAGCAALVVSNWLTLLGALLLIVRRDLALAVMLGVVSAAAFVMYPFSRQTASFPKILEPSEDR